MKATKEAPPLNYIYARESYLRALGRYQAAEENLRAILGAKNCYADLDRAILEARTKGLHTSTIYAYQELARALDEASKKLDLAEELQRRRVAQSELDRDISRLDC